MEYRYLLVSLVCYTGFLSARCEHLNNDVADSCDSESPPRSRSSLYCTKPPECPPPPPLYCPHPSPEKTDRASERTNTLYCRHKYEPKTPEEPCPPPPPPERGYALYCIHKPVPEKPAEPKPKHSVYSPYCTHQPTREEENELCEKPPASAPPPHHHYRNTPYCTRQEVCKEEPTPKIRKYNTRYCVSGYTPTPKPEKDTCVSPYCRCEELAALPKADETRSVRRPRSKICRHQPRWEEKTTPAEGKKAEPTSQPKWEETKEQQAKKHTIERHTSPRCTYNETDTTQEPQARKRIHSSIYSNTFQGYEKSHNDYWEKHNSKPKKPPPYPPVTSSVTPPTDYEDKPAPQEHTPTDHQTEPTPQELQPTDHEDKATSQEHTSADHQTEPTLQEAQPTGHEDKPAPQEHTPTDHQTEPTPQESQLTDHEDKATSQEHTSADHQTESTLQEPQPTDHEDKATPQDHLSAGHDPEPTPLDQQTAKHEDKTTSQEHLSADHDPEPTSLEQHPAAAIQENKEDDSPQAHLTSPPLAASSPPPPPLLSAKPSPKPVKATSVDHTQPACEPLCCLSDTSNPLDTRIVLRHREPGGIGYNLGYSSFDIFITPERKDWGTYYLDLRGHIFNDGRWATNVGLGVRYVPSCFNVVYGGNVYWDWRNTKHTEYQQIGAGLEVMWPCWDLRVNGYFPINRKKKTLSKKFKGFRGNSAIFRRRTDLRLKGVDGSLGWIAYQNSCFRLYTSLGGYYLTGDLNTNFGGGYFRAELGVTDYFTIDGNVSYDKEFKWVGQGQASLVFPFGPCKQPKSCWVDCCNIVSIDERLSDQPYRFEIIPTTRKTQTSVATDLLGNPLFFLFVDNTSGSVGTFEDPYATLADASAASKPADIIYVFPGDETDTGMNTGITLLDQQSLVSSGAPFTVNTRFGLLDIPPTTSKPKLSNAGSNVVTLANNNTVLGFQITSSGNFSSIIAPNASEKPTIQYNTLASEGRCISFTDVISGPIVITNNQISTNGLFFGPTNGGIVADAVIRGSVEIKNNSFSIQDNMGSFGISFAESVNGPITITDNFATIGEAIGGPGSFLAACLNTSGNGQLDLKRNHLDLFSSTALNIPLTYYGDVDISDNTTTAQAGNMTLTQFAIADLVGDITFARNTTSISEGLGGTALSILSSQGSTTIVDNTFALTTTGAADTTAIGFTTKSGEINISRNTVQIQADSNIFGISLLAHNGGPFTLSENNFDLASSGLAIVTGVNLGNIQGTPLSLIHNTFDLTSGGSSFAIGSIQNLSSPLFSIENNTFTCSATQDAASYVAAGGSTIIFESFLFTNNRVVSTGSGLGPLGISGLILSDNTSSENFFIEGNSFTTTGSAIRATGLVSIENGLLRNNTFQQTGNLGTDCIGLTIPPATGAVNLRFSNNSIISNSPASGVTGRALNYAGPSNDVGKGIIFLKNTLFSNNTSEDALFDSTGAPATLEFQSPNEASSGIDATNEGTINLTDIDFTPYNP